MAPPGEKLVRLAPRGRMLAFRRDEGISCLDTVPTLATVPAEPDGDRHLDLLRDGRRSVRGHDVADREPVLFVGRVLDRVGRSEPMTRRQASWLAELVPDAVVTRSGDPRSAAIDDGVLFAEERDLANRALAPSRRREFVLARQLAHDAMRELDVPVQPIGRHDDRSPRWPDGIVGSISHTKTCCVVALAPADAVAAIGIDVERDEPLAPRVEARICVPSELEWLDTLAPSDRARAAKTVFSAKETAYKAQFPSSRTFLGFAAMAVRIDLATGCWRATFEPGQRPPACPWSTFDGRFGWRDGLVATAVVVAR